VAVTGRTTQCRAVGGWLPAASLKVKRTLLAACWSLPADCYRPSAVRGCRV